MPAAPALRLTPHRRLSFLACRADALEHELVTQRGVAERLAELIGCRFAGHLDPAAPTGPFGYVVPNDTIVGIDTAQRLGILGEEDFFGGVVPFPFVATKVITHARVDSHADAPTGWNDEFGERVSGVVLPGYSAFSIRDARTAAQRLLPYGAVRIKLASGIGGLCQSVADDEAQFDAWLATADADQLARHGVVIERNLNRARTFSIGLLRVGTLLASYSGTQCTTRNRHGQEVYGGSSITVSRGGFDSLEQMTGGDADVRRAVALARTYHSAARDCFAGMFASRCNYDVAQGCDANGRPLAGVLEQSWRMGGASGAEVAALQALCSDPSLERVRASTVEVHGPDVVVPDGATVYFSGVDKHVGPITKYALVHLDADA